MLVSELNSNQIHSLAHAAFNACAEFYGVSKYFMGFPHLELINDDNELLSGEFRDDICEIMINIASIRNAEDLCLTICHEYQHYLQSPRWMKRYYTMGYDYFNHPYEVQAYNKEHEILNFFNHDDYSSTTAG